MKTRLAFAIASALAAVSFAAPATAALRALYTFEGTLADASGNGFAGTATNGPAFTAAGYEGQGLAFDAALNQFVTFTGLDIKAAAMPQITFGAWFRATDASPIRGVLSHDDVDYDRTIDIDFRGGSTGWSAFRGDGVVYGGDVTPGVWTFVAVRHDQASGALTLFVDGTATSAAGVSFGTGLGSLTLGRNPTFDAPFAGQADNVFVFDEALSDARIEQIRLGGAAAIAAVPEPATWLSLAGGLAVLAATRRRR